MAKKLKDVLSADLYALVEAEISAHENVSLLVNETTDGKTTYVPLERLSAVVAEKKSLQEENTALTTSLEGLKQGNKDNEGLQSEITKYQTEIDDLKRANEKAISDIKFQTKLDMELLKLKPTVDVNAVKALFDTSKISMDGDNLIGFNDQATKIMENNKPLFATEKADLPQGDNGKNKGTGTVVNPFLKETRSIIGQVKLKQNDPALYEKMKAEAESI
jgi:hypothetical protein